MELKLTAGEIVTARDYELAAVLAVRSGPDKRWHKGICCAATTIHAGRLSVARFDPGMESASSRNGFGQTKSGRRAALVDEVTRNQVGSAFSRFAAA
jgi:hypothetical protein